MVDRGGGISRPNRNIRRERSTERNRIMPWPRVFESIGDRCDGMLRYLSTISTFIPELPNDGACMTGPLSSLRRLSASDGRRIPRAKGFGLITKVTTLVPAVALTFDDGPSPVYTSRLMDVLNRYNAKATFFMLGSAARAYPDLVRTVFDAGHAIGNHSYSHCDFVEVSHRTRLAEIRACSRALDNYESKIFRPPYGRQNLAAYFAARSLGYKTIKWTISAGDWKGLTSSEIADSVLCRLHPGAIVLLHDSIATRPGEDQSATIDAVERILAHTAGDYQYLTIPELFRLGRAS